jgi:photosynthetic reaction center cytochrome c subunit
MTRHGLVCTVAILVCSLGLSAQQQPAAGAPQGPPPPWAPIKNLQILPADIARADLINTMKGFTRALGVRCTNCHIGEESQPIQSYDFASDTKPAKRTARIMLRMMADVNAKLASVGDKPAGEPRVTCYSCHRGEQKPVNTPPPQAGG